jgi:hypothetical protein
MFLKMKDSRMFLIGVLVGALLAYFCRPKIGRPKIEWAKDKKDAGKLVGNTERAKEWNKHCGHKTAILKTRWNGTECQVSKGICPNDPNIFPNEWNQEPDPGQRARNDRCANDAEVDIRTPYIYSDDGNCQTDASGEEWCDWHG